MGIREANEVHLHIILQEPVGNLGQVSRLAHAVDAHKDNSVRLALGLCRVDFAHDVNRAAGRQDSRQRILDRPSHRTADPREALQPLTYQILRYRIAQPAR